MKALNHIEFVAEGAGYYKVFRDGVQISQHTGIHKAQERATNEKIQHPESNVWYEQVLRVDCNARFDEVDKFIDDDSTTSETRMFTTE